MNTTFEMTTVMEAGYDRPYTRRQIKTLLTQILDTREDYETTQEYIQALRTLNYGVLEFFQEMGEDARHRISNVHTLKRAHLYGFTTVCIDKCGWAKANSWPETETIELRQKSDNACCNEITLAKGLNGKYCYGLDYTYGGAGGCFGPCYFSNPYDSRSQCLSAALDSLQAKMEDALTRNCEHPDSTNFKVPYTHRS